MMKRLAETVTNRSIVDVLQGPQYTSENIEL